MVANTEFSALFQSLVDSPGQRNAEANCRAISMSVAGCHKQVCFIQHHLHCSKPPLSRFSLKIETAPGKIKSWKHI